MARRTVILGWRGTALEVAADDASALAQSKWIRVSFTQYDTGDLADATVCYPHKALLGVPMENATQAQFERAFERIQRMCPRARALTIPDGRILPQH